MALIACWEVLMALVLTSTAFREGAEIPAKHTCDAADTSPQLAWSGAPPGTVALALIADDPDAPAGTWVHWVLYNLPGRLTGLPEGLAKTERQRRAGATKQEVERAMEGHIIAEARLMGTYAR